MGNSGLSGSFFLHFFGPGTGPHWCGWARIVERLPESIEESLLDFLDERGTSESAMATQTSNPENRTETKIPATMRAVVYRGVNDMRLETVPVPAIGPGELLVKVATCGICGTDLKKIHTGSHSAPRIFGHEMAGTIVAGGRGRGRFAVGERVMVFHHVPCGECYYCRKQTSGAVPGLQESGRHGRLSSPPAAALPSTFA
jgi:hypothetical protein